ncbi:MAG: sigma-70 family RNA polymerase sigma factor [Deltaproteobacteria bacterium]|nr:sigma-70 family RNA polymerase sigma factor [Deltaproteobacteria bacterium]
MSKLETVPNDVFWRLVPRRARAFVQASRPSTASSTAVSAVDDVNELYGTHIGLLRRRATRLVRNEELAKDLAHEAFVSFIVHRERGGREQHAAAFLFRAVTNLALNVLRDSKTRERLLREKVYQPDAPLAGPQADLRADIRWLLGQVDPENAIVAIHHFIDGMDQDEIASLVGVPRRTVGRRIERFTKQARRLLEAY